MGKDCSNADHEDPFLSQLDNDCRDILENGREADYEQLVRLVAMQGQQVVFIRREAVTRSECRHIRAQSSQSDESNDESDQKPITFLNANWKTIAALVPPYLGLLGFLFSLIWRVLTSTN